MCYCWSLPSDTLNISLQILYSAHHSGKILGINKQGSARILVNQAEIFRLRRRLGGSTVKTVVVPYSVAVLLGAAGLSVLYLDERATLILTAAVGVAMAAFLLWLARLPMES